MARDVDDLLSSIDDVLGPDDCAPVPGYWDLGYSARDAMDWRADGSAPPDARQFAAAMRAAGRAASIRPVITLDVSGLERALTHLREALGRTVPSIQRVCDVLGLPYEAPTSAHRRVDAARQRRVATAMRRVERRAARRR